MGSSTFSLQMLQAQETIPYLWKVYTIKHNFTGIIILFCLLCRSVSDYHLQEIAKYCHELEQLDILGSNMVTVKGVSE